MYVYWLFTSKVGDDWCILFFSLFLSSKRLAFISVVGEGSSNLVGTKPKLCLTVLLLGNFQHTYLFLWRVFNSNFCQNFNGFPFSYFLPVPPPLHLQQLPRIHAESKDKRDKCMSTYVCHVATTMQQTGP